MKTIPAMITPQEQSYLREYASKEFRGEGSMVDLGCWLGSSCCALAEGLSQNSRLVGTNQVVEAYDRFIWEDWMDFPHLFQGTDLEGHFQAGQSFFPECQRFCQSWASRIRFHPGDLVQLGWDGQEIEFLFVDAMKSWELANAIIRNFYSRLIVGRSVVVQQDFWSYHVYWLHLLCYRFRSYFEPIFDVPHSPSLVFRYVRQIPEEELGLTYSLASFDDQEIDAAFQYAQSLVASHKQPMVSLAKVRLYQERADATGFERAMLATSNLLYGLPRTDDLLEQLRLARLPRRQSFRLWLRQRLTALVKSLRLAGIR